ncbi:MAG TPA: hypothetical protein VKT81_22995, partial [Bryobacteraceae bacterium]|nr:hypothetical protein [Bryobacteraceae bacterium]
MANLTAFFLFDAGQILKSRERGIQFAEFLFLAVLALAVYFLPRRAKRWLHQVESRWSTFYSRNKIAAIVVLGLLPAVLRIALLPAVAIPIPVVPDEFSHLLLADTIASGRLTNPPHPLAPHFEATYVLQDPTYASVYPPGHGILMGIAQLLGLHPWYGVLAEVSLMAMAIAWMLDAWFAPRWVLLGTMLAVIRLGIWMTSYWGGSLAAIGGALLIGSLKRIWDEPRIRDGLVLGLSIVILANSRPYEGGLLSLAAFCFLAVHVMRASWPQRRKIFGTVVTPLAACLAVGAAGMAYYDWRVTGNAFTMPYVADRHSSGVPQSFAFNPPVPAPPKLAQFPDLMKNYQWELDAYRSARDASKIWSIAWGKLAIFWSFYLNPLLTVPLLALPWILRDARMRVLLLAGMFVLLGTCLYPFYFAHYSAPLAGIFIVMVVQGLRYLSLVTRKKPGGGPTLAPLVTTAIATAGLALALLAFVFHDAVKTRQFSVYPAANLVRDRIERRLSGSPGKSHLVIVRYAANHDFHRCMTYNRADIDKARVVWARELDPASNRNLLDYFQQRTVWLYEPDATP